MTDDAKPERRDVEIVQPEPADVASDTPTSTSGAIGAEPDVAAQRDEYYDLLLRKTAEFDNYRKRIERERAEVAQAAAIELIEELLPLVDDFERALRVEPAGDAAIAYRKGVELIYTQLLELLRKQGVTPIAAAGADFDPHFHQAVVHEVSAAHRDGEVIDELRRGYMLRSRLLRPAMVRVAKT